MEVLERVRLRIGRELAGLTQTDLARAVDLTPAAVSQFENGAARPAPETLARLAEVMGLPQAFFFQPVTETHEGFFRSLRKTPVAERRRARAVAHVIHDLAIGALNDGLFPINGVPRLASVGVEAAKEQVESIAQAVRASWGLVGGPIPNMVSLLEHHGVVVARLPMNSMDVDAFSLPFTDVPVVMLGADKGDKARSRFDAAHELGHLVMHGEEIWGMKETEDQAHWFAAEMLMPAKDIRTSLPTSLDWTALMHLKRQWQVSLAALLMRARHLQRIDESTYLAGVKAMSARGWRRKEPVYLGPPEEPSLLIHYLESPGSGEVAKRLPTGLVERLAKAAVSY